LRRLVNHELPGIAAVQQGSHHQSDFPGQLQIHAKLLILFAISMSSSKRSQYSATCFEVEDFCHKIASSPSSPTQDADNQTCTVNRVEGAGLNNSQKIHLGYDFKVMARSDSIGQNFAFGLCKTRIALPCHCRHLNNNEKMHIWKLRCRIFFAFAAFTGNLAIVVQVCVTSVAINLTWCQHYQNKQTV